MALADCLILIGGIMLLTGLLMAFISARRFTAVMGEARKGYACLAPDEGSPEDVEKDRLLKRSDVAFLWGLGLTATGVILQTAGALVAGSH